MNFKKALLFVPMCLTLASCSDFLRGQKKEEDVIELKKDTFSCLDKAVDSLRDVLADSSSADLVDQSLSCVVTSLDYFKRKTKGSKENPNIYYVENIRLFFGKYLGDHNRVSDEMALQMMKIKSAILGGNEKWMTKEELQSLIDFIVQIQKEVRILKPHWDLILAKKNQRIAVDQVAIGHAHTALQKSLTRLLYQTHLPRSDYSFQDFKSLLGEIENFVRNSPRKSEIAIQAWLKLVESIKNTLFGSIVEMNSRARWNEAIGMVLELHKLYLLYEFQFQRLEFYSPKGLKVADEMLLILIRLLDRSWVLQKSGISFDVTQDLFVQLGAKGYLPKGVSALALDETYRGIVRKVLERELKNPEETLLGLERRHVGVLKGEYEVWRSIQNFVNEFPQIFSFADLEKKLKTYQPQFGSEFPLPSLGKFQLAWQDWKSHFLKDHPIFYLPTGEIVVSPKLKQRPDWSWYSLARTNLMGMFSRILMLGYGTKRTMVLQEERIQESQMVQWYGDYVKLGVELKAFDSKSENSGARSFFEADHFLYSSNGDGAMDQQEAFEFVNMIFSSGLSGLRKVQDALKASQCQMKTLEPDHFGNLKSEQKCFGELLRHQFSNLFQNLEGFKSAVGKMSDPEWQEFFEDLIYFSQDSKSKRGQIETSDLRTLVVILHYLETLFVSFDQDRDGRLSKEELERGSHRFALFFKAQFKWESDPGSFKEQIYDLLVTQGFSCMVLSGEFPNIKTCSRILSGEFFEKQYSDRTKILKTLNQFKSKLGP